MFSFVHDDANENDIAETEVTLEDMIADDLPTIPINLPQKALKDIAVSGNFPEHMRGFLWFKLMNCDDNSPYCGTKIYDKLCDMPHAPCENDIITDVNRTLATHSYFRDRDTGQASLFRILRAYSLLDASIGYCQGSAYLAALFLLHLPEPQAFNLLATVIEARSIQKLFRHGMVGLQQLFAQLDNAIGVASPELAQKFSSDGLETSAFASPWMLTVFSSSFAQRPDLVVRIWDLFLAIGWSAVLQASLAVLVTQKNKIMASHDLFQTLNMLKSLPEQSQVSSDEFIACALSFDIFGQVTI